MFVQADELINNKDKNTVTAEGNARIYYKGRTLEADRVVYDRNTNRVYAEGHAKLTERDGTVVHAKSFDLTQDFRDGFIESLRADTTAKTFLSAPRAERTGGDTMVYDKGTYTACETCKEHPEKPPLWRVRAMRIIHNKDEQMVYYTNAWLEFGGIPVAYFPFLSSPDPTVKRKSGILTPQYMSNSYLGNGFALPIFWALAPNYDVTLTPTYWSTQGFFGDVLWRHRLASGSYFVRANGIFPQHPQDFAPPPYGAADRTFRGEFASKGDFSLAPKWNLGWDVTLLSDKWYIFDYKVPTQSLTSYYISDVTSTAYLTGQGDRSYFDLRGFYFQGLASHDFQPQQPLALPVLNYNRTFDIDPAKTHGIGGQVQFDFNLTSLSSAAASYQAVGAHIYDAAYGLYDICANYRPGVTTGSCLLRGIGGNYTRATADVSWKSKYIDPIGEVWTPFAFARINGQTLDLNTTNSYTFSSASGTSTFTNASQSNFGVNSGAYGYAMPGVGFEYRYPLFTNTPLGSLEAEPIGQIIARPNSVLGTNSLVNMDSQSLVFDTTNLFAWDKYSGYDQFETGLRANYGGQATFRFNNGGYVNFMAGQSAQVAGTNSYATPDAANIGLSSGLNTPWSDYVAAFTFVPSTLLTFMADGSFDPTTLSPRRFDFMTNVNLGALTGGVQYANYEAQPLIGYQVRREGLALNARYAFTKSYFVSGNISFDMSRQFYPISMTSFQSGPFAISSYGLAGGYKDDCTTVQVSYTNVYEDIGTGSFIHNQTLLVTLQLRTLGDTSFSQNFLSAPSATTTP
ncbi:LPS-assembly protein LptD [Methylovirgula sp. HY1]|uniref:LPS-assembly protein LptD n=1 Tax=Methylovirgula sp. HY1 TaxID=2822761 RepID=UPI002106BA1F|nr:LPS assembly protein LptD [Methylovirgula sp. HY1]